MTVFLQRDDEGLALRTPNGVTVRAATEFLSAPRPGKDLLGRAIKAALRSRVGSAAPERGEIIDATAGLGADSFHLAALGLEVTMVERVPQVAELLRDALERAAAGLLGENARLAAGNLTLEVGDARTVLEARVAAGRPPWVVYLDPMYPKQKKAALPGKGMALFRELVGEDIDSVRLLETAMRCAERRVVVKRPRKATYLGGYEPTGSLEGSTTRYDLYAPLVTPTAAK